MGYNRCAAMETSKRTTNTILSQVWLWAMTQVHLGVITLGNWVGEHDPQTIIVGRREEEGGILY